MANIIRLVSRSNVQAATRDLTRCKSKRIDLTSPDIKSLLIWPIQKGLLFSKPESSNVPNQKNLLQHLKTSLSRTLGFFYPLAGRLAAIKHEDKKTMSVIIDCNNIGAQFDHVIANKIKISDILEPLYVPEIVRSFFPLNGTKNYDGVSKPLLGVQVTELADGIFIGFTVNHAVADGIAFWHFINSWSEISRGGNNFDRISKPPVFEHWLRSGNYCPIRFPVSIMETEDDYSSSPLQKRIFHFSKETIAKLKARANMEAVDVAEDEAARIGKISISSLQSLWAHVWRSLVRNQQLDPEKETHFHSVMDLRSRLKDPQMAGDYFGNAIHSMTLTMKAREILDSRIGHIALQMKKMIWRHGTEESIRNHLEGWIKNPRLITPGSLSRNSVVALNSPRFNVFGNDFGWGRPIAVRSGAANDLNGLFSAYPGGLEDGSIDIEVCALPEILQAIGNDSKFII